MLIGNWIYCWRRPLCIECQRENRKFFNLLLVNGRVHYHNLFFFLFLTSLCSYLFPSLSFISVIRRTIWYIASLFCIRLGFFGQILTFYSCLFSLETYHNNKKKGFFFFFVYILLLNFQLNWIYKTAWDILNVVTMKMSGGHLPEIMLNHQTNRNSNESECGIPNGIAHITGSTTKLFHWIIISILIHH